MIRRLFVGHEPPDALMAVRARHNHVDAVRLGIVRDYGAARSPCSSTSRWHRLIRSGRTVGGRRKVELFGDLVGGDSQFSETVCQRHVRIVQTEEAKHEAFHNADGSVGATDVEFCVVG